MPENSQPKRPAADVKAQINRLLPPQVNDRKGWRDDIFVAFDRQQLATTNDNICAVLAIAEQETNYNADASVPDLSRIAWHEIERRAAILHIPFFLVRTALMLRSPDGQSYAGRLDGVRTEKALSAIFDDLISIVPMGQKLFGTLNPVRTGGPMQVSIAFAEAHAKDYPYPVDGSVRREVFSRRGGLYFGTRHLLGYPANYTRMIYRFADFNAGWYASRNAAFQAAVARLSGMTLALDGDLIAYDTETVGATERAVQALSETLGMSHKTLRRALEQGDSETFEQTDLWQAVFALADKQAGKRLPRERLPGITLNSPKITRNLTTAWFAQRVETRWQRCRDRANTKGR